MKGQIARICETMGQGQRSNMTKVTMGLQEGTFLNKKSYSKRGPSINYHYVPYNTSLCLQNTWKEGHSAYLKTNGDCFIIY